MKILELPVQYTSVSSVRSSYLVSNLLAVGLNYETEAELRQKRLGKVGELLAIVIMSAGCLTVVRLAFRKNFSS